MKNIYLYFNYSVVLRVLSSIQKRKTEKKFDRQEMNEKGTVPGSNPQNGYHTITYLHIGTVQIERKCGK